MTRENQDFTMWQGEDKRVQAAVVNAAGAPFDLTGCTITWQVFRSLQSVTPAISKGTGSGITVISINAANDGLEIKLADTDTQELEAMAYYHECRVTDAGGYEEVVFVGALDLRPSKTNS